MGLFSSTFSAGDIFLKLMEHFPEIRFKNESHFLGYLKAVCEHYVIDMVRKYEKQTYEELAQELQIRAPGETPEQAAANVERRERLIQLIGKAPGTCQNLLRAFLDEGLGLAEIAARQTFPSERSIRDFRAVSRSCAAEQARLNERCKLRK